MQHHLGHAGGAGGKVEEHDVLILGISIAHRLLPLVGGGGEALVVAAPAGAAGAHQHLVAQGRAVGLGLLHGVRHAGGVLRADDGGHVRSVDTVADVLGSKQVRGRDGDGPDLVQGNDDGPELVVPLEDQHHGVALLHADGLEVVGGAVGIQHHAAEVVRYHIALGIGPQEGLAVGILPSQAIHHVVGKVEGIRALEAEILVEILIADEVALDIHIFMVQRLHIHSSFPV